MDAIWVTAIVQMGAMGILAYHFLLGLPMILERIAKDQQHERAFWADQAALDRADFGRRAEVIATELRRLTAERNGDASV